MLILLSVSQRLAKYRGSLYCLNFSIPHLNSVQGTIKLNFFLIGSLLGILFDPEDGCPERSDYKIISKRRVVWSS